MIECSLPALPHSPLSKRCAFLRGSCGTFAKCRPSRASTAVRPLGSLFSLIAVFAKHAQSGYALYLRYLIHRFRNAAHFFAVHEGRSPNVALAVRARQCGRLAHCLA